MSWGIAAAMASETDRDLPAYLGEVAYRHFDRDDPGSELDAQFLELTHERYREIAYRKDLIEAGRSPDEKRTWLFNPDICTAGPLATAMGGVCASDCVDSIPAGDAVIYTRSDDRRRSRKFVSDIRKLQARGCEIVAVVAPWAKARGLGESWDDLIQAEGIGAAVARIRTAIEVPPRLTADEIGRQGRKAIFRWVGEARAAADRRIEAAQSGVKLRDLPPGPQGIALLAMETGKTLAALLAAQHEMRAADPKRAVPFRAAFIVPDHSLATDVFDRAKAISADYPVQIHRGLERPDPEMPGRAMCPEFRAVNEIIKAGGKITDRCAGCVHHPDHPKATPENICGRMRERPIEHGLIIIAGPETLTKAPPGAFARHITVDGERITVPPFDVIFADEQSFTAMVGGQGSEPYDVRLTSLLEPLRAFEDEATPEQEQAIADADAAFIPLYKRLIERKAGHLTMEEMHEIAGGPKWEHIRRAVLSLKAEPRKLIKPNTPAEELPALLADCRAHNKRIFALARLAQVIQHAADASEFADNSESGRIELVGRAERVLRLRWIEPIAPAWDGTPILILDGTGDEHIARRWLPNLRVIARLQSIATPDCVTRTQVVDKAFSYRLWVPEREEPPKTDDDVSADERTRWNNVARLARLMTVRAWRYRDQGIGDWDCLFVVPLRLQRALEKWFAQNGGKPPRIAIEHYFKVAGLDMYGGVRHAMLVSRPLPPPAVVERLAWAISGVRGIPLAPDETGRYRYPQKPTAYTLRGGKQVTHLPDGTPVTTPYHPDPDCDRVLEQICTAELEQSAARPRPSRRTPDRPLDIEILTDTVLPIEVDRLVMADEICSDGHPAKWLIARGIAPVLASKGGRPVLAAILGKSDDATKKMLARDPAWAALAHRGQTPLEGTLREDVPRETWQDFSVRLPDARYAAKVAFRASTVPEAEAILASFGIVDAEVRLTPAPEVRETARPAEPAPAPAPQTEAPAPAPEPPPAPEPRMPVPVFRMPWARTPPPRATVRIQVQKVPDDDPLPRVPIFVTRWDRPIASAPPPSF